MERSTRWCCKWLIFSFDERKQTFYRTCNKLAIHLSQSHQKQNRNWHNQGTKKIKVSRNYKGRRSTIWNTCWAESSVKQSFQTPCNKNSMNHLRIRIRITRGYRQHQIQIKESYFEENRRNVIPSSQISCVEIWCF